MNIEQLRDYCLSLPSVAETMPFGPDTLCYTLAGKTFALLCLDNHSDFANLKCNPERAVGLRENYQGIKPGWHMNKRHWNSVYFRSDVGDALFLSLVNHAYNMVLAQLPKRLQTNYAPLPDNMD